MKKVAAWTVVAFAFAGWAQANEFRLGRPFDQSNFVHGSQFGIKTDMAFDRSAGRILLKRNHFPVPIHIDGRFSIFMAALEGPLSKKATFWVVACDADDNVIATLKEKLRREQFLATGLRTNRSKVNGYFAKTRSITWDLPADSKVDYLIQFNKITGPGKSYFQFGIEDDDGDSDTD